MGSSVMAQAFQEVSGGSQISVFSEEITGGWVKGEGWGLFLLTLR